MVTSKMLNVFVELLINYNLFYKSICEWNNNRRNVKNSWDILQGEHVLTRSLDNWISFF